MKYFGPFLFLLFIFSCGESVEKVNKVKEKKDSIPESPKKEGNKFTKSLFTGKSLYMISGEVDNEEYLLPSVKVEVFADGSLDTVVFTNDTGYYEVNHLPVNKEYKLRFSLRGSFAKFCVLKRISKNDLDSIGKFYLYINTTLLEEKLFDLEQLEPLRTIPAAVGSYNAELDNIEWDLEKAEDYSKKLNKAMKVRIRL